jgi:hypothetical protein
MKSSMTYRSYLGWQKYWEEEPWGPWRDNLHTAMVAREIRRTVFKSGLSLEGFMYTNPYRTVVDGDSKLAATLGTVATKVTAKEAQRRLRAARKNRKRQK